MSKVDHKCVPYEKRGRYFELTGVLLIVQTFVFLYLWTINPILSLIMIVLYLMTSYFQSYCCVYQDCPYVGEFCPAVSGVYLGNILAKRLYSKDTPKSERKFQTYKNLGIVFWLLMAFFPLYWVYLLGLHYAIGYVAFHLTYYLAYGLTICPSCAIRETCPGGGLQKQLLR
jgi:hypothetical protein